jgi:hypothetical protein
MGVVEVAGAIAGVGVSARFSAFGEDLVDDGLDLVVFVVGGVLGGAETRLALAHLYLVVGRRVGGRLRGGVGVGWRVVVWLMISGWGWVVFRWDEFVGEVVGYFALVLV